MQRKDGRENEGMMKLLCYYRSIFRTDENVNHYSQADFREAEKKFLKHTLLGHDLNSGRGEMERSIK
jgi:hypothetical protein